MIKTVEVEAYVDDATGKVIEKGGWVLAPLRTSLARGGREYHFQGLSEMIAFLIDGKHPSLKTSYLEIAVNQKAKRRKVVSV
jgi:hypothetical protein